MHYMIPDDYDTFYCLADRCPDTCCRGWQIAIDRASLIRYAQMPGLIGNRVRNSIDWRGGEFLQDEQGCVLQGDEGLCDLQLEAGEAALCDTCRLYPRHEEEYDHVRERSLSLSCPKAAEMVLSRQTPLAFLEWDTEEEDDFEDFDGVLFDQLRELRRVMLGIAGNRDLPLTERMRQICDLGRQAQESLAEEETPAEDSREEAEAEQSAENSRRRAGEETPAEDSRGRKEAMIRSELFGMADLKERFALLRELSLRDERWMEMLDRTWEQLDTAEDQLYCRTGEWLNRYPVAGEQLLSHLLYVWLCGAVYDRKISSKSLLAVFSVLCIFMAAAGSAAECPDEDGIGLLTEAAWRFGRSIEHDDENLERLERVFYGDDFLL